MVGSIASSPAVDLSTLPALSIVPTPDFETRLQGKLARLTEQMPSFSALVESDPAMALLQADAFDEMHLAQAFNEVASARLLAFATGADLDHLGALFDVERHIVSPATDSAPAVMESDTAYRQRIQLAPHRFSVAGPELAYVFHAKSAHGDVLDATAFSPYPADIRALVLGVLADHDAAPALVAAMADALDDADWPGDVKVTVLSASGNGIPSAEVLQAVDTHLQGDVRPMTDRVIVQPVELVDFGIVAHLYVYAGPDEGLILATANASLDKHLAEIRKLGRDVTRSGISAALHVGNVHRVDLLEPATDKAISQTQIGHVTSRTVTVAGTQW